MSDELVDVGDWGCIGRLVSSGFPLLSAEASEIMKSIGEAIQYLHSINIAHRDVKVTPAYTPRSGRLGPNPDCLIFQGRMVCSPVCSLWGLG